MAQRDDQAFIDRDERMFQDEERKIQEERFLPADWLDHVERNERETMTQIFRVFDPRKEFVVFAIECKANDETHARQIFCTITGCSAGHPLMVVNITDRKEVF